MVWSLVSPLQNRSRLSDPFTSLDQMMKDIWSVAPAAAAPLKLDVKEDENAFHITADLPGLSENDVEVTFQDDTLTIRGEKKIERDEKKDTWHMTERSYGNFERRLAFPNTIEADKIEAKFDKGVLTINLPKQPEQKSKVKKIEVH